MRAVTLGASAAVVALAGEAGCSPGDDTRNSLMRIADEQLLFVSAEAHALWGVLDAVGLNGEYWVLTGSEPFVHVFGVGGVQVAAFGTKGDGPGELHFPRALWPGAPKGTMSVWDSGRRRVATFSREGELVASRTVPTPGVVRADMDDVTYGDPFRVVQEAGGTILQVHYDSPVTHPTHLWSGRLLRIGDHPGDEVETISSFLRDLPGAARRQGNRDAPMFLGPVPLWDGCPAGGAAVLDAVARTVYFYDRPGSVTAGPDSLALPWRPGPLPAEDHVAYIRHQMKAETRGQNVDESEIEALAVRAARDAQGLFSPVAPVAVDLRCGPNRIWLQEYDGRSSPLGYGASWRTASMDELGQPRFMRVVFPSGFSPLRFLGPQVLGIVVNSSGMERLAVAKLFQQGESGP